MMFKSLVLLCACLIPATVQAGRIDFYSNTLDTPGTVNFGTSGALSGTIPVVNIAGTDTSKNNGAQILPAPGRAPTLTFALGAVTGGNATSGYTYAAGGSVTIVGQILGATTSETLLTATLGAGTLQNLSTPSQPNAYQLFVNAGSLTSISPRLLTYFGDSYTFGMFDLAFSGTPGSVANQMNQLAVLEIVTPTTSGGVPEPASVAMLALGLVAAWGVGRGASRLNLES